ncbi:hypothetical protein GGX14DRAFT_660667 [Mycena pura]|uniref:Uncharacterized protein n=1 Tax=Mycena pura TaxID=153505 RepID=A0AAD6V5C0_9AGAR|nr:hypothetical protein GGX14DRAFT_660667 [Mycena pura]
MLDLPAEIWTHVFDIAADEDVIFHHGLPTAMAESAWFKDFHGEWALRSPQDALELIQRRSYGTKKARHSRLLTLCAILDSSSAGATTATASLGWWTRRIQLTRFYANTTREATPETLQDALISIVRHCPNLEIFIIDWPMTGPIFGPIADALATYTAKDLRTLHINVPSSALSKVIWALDSLPHVFAAHIELEAEASPNLEEQSSDETPLGAACDIRLRLPNLRQLSLRGHIQQFLEQATGWGLPSLRYLSLDCGHVRVDLPDTLSFLTIHGAPLLFLDLYSVPALPLARLLAECPSLTTLAFNGDWRIVGADDDPGAPPFAHDRLTSVGLHGLAYAFGVGDAAAQALTDSLPAWLVTAASDRTFAALCVRESFPALQRVRVLSRSLLGELDRANGPSAENGGMERWERWWETSRRAGVRLEDCTGSLLGELPQDEPESESEEEEDEWEAPLEPDSERISNIEELQLLLEECRAMDSGRDDNYLHQSAEAMAMFPDVASGSDT